VQLTAVALEKSRGGQAERPAARRTKSRPRLQRRRLHLGKHGIL